MVYIEITKHTNIRRPYKRPYKNIIVREKKLFI